MRAAAAEHLERALVELRTCGLLLGSDAELPSVVTSVAGEAVRGSWWKHPAAHDIHEVSEALGDHEDVIIAKLISGKDTYIHRHLWPEIAAVGSAREAWQLERLSPMAERLLTLVTADGELRSDQVPWTGGPRKDSPGQAARLLQRRLLVYAEEVHTESGAHAKRLETWEHWAARAGLAGTGLTVEQGRRKIEGIVRTLNARFKAKGALPWPATVNS